jgi:hypothetical protein
MPGAIGINHNVDAASDGTIGRPAQQEDASPLNERTNSLLAYARSIKQPTLVGPSLDIPFGPVRGVHDCRYLSGISHYGIDEKHASRSLRFVYQSTQLSVGKLSADRQIRSGKLPDTRGKEASARRVTIQAHQQHGHAGVEVQKRIRQAGGLGRPENPSMVGGG